MTKNPLMQLLFALALLVAACAAAGAGYLLTARESVASAALASDIGKKTLEANKVASARATLAALENDEAAIEAYTVPEDGVVPFLGELEQKGASVGAKVTVVSVVADQEPPHPHLTLSLQVTGTFDAVMRTLGLIEYAPYDSTLGSLTLDTPAVYDPATSSWTAAAVFSVGTTPTTTPAQ